jgi:hypothetical protein
VPRPTDRTASAAPHARGALGLARIAPDRDRSWSQTGRVARRRAIATRRGYCSWDVDHAGWVVSLHSPEEQDFYGRTLEEALAWCLVWLMAPELGVGPFRT